MIRINLLGQLRPKASRRPVPLGSALPTVLVGAGILFGLAILTFYYFTLQKDLGQAQDRIKQLRAQKTDLEQIKQQVEAFDNERRVLQQRVAVIEQLQRDRTGGQELLDMVASTVSRTENLWLTSMTRKGGSLAIEGAAASVNSVANFITQLKRSGYFQKVEIKETKQDEKNAAVQTFTFQLSADIVPPGGPAARPASVPAQPAVKSTAPAKKG
jgi:type IV pilus assembly protein PilN